MFNTFLFTISAPTTWLQLDFEYNIFIIYSKFHFTVKMFLEIIISCFSIRALATVVLVTKKNNYTTFHLKPV